MKDTTFVQVHSKTTVPLIEEVRFHIIITNNIEQSHKEFNLIYEPKTCVHVGGEVHMDDGALDCYLFLHQTCVTHDFIGHELHHALHQICNRIGVKASIKHDEMTARVTGYLHAWTYRQLEKAGIPVLHKTQRS